MLNGWLYALLCLLLPIAWGVVVFWGTNKIESWRHEKMAKEGGGGKLPMNPISPDYHI